MRSPTWPSSTTACPASPAPTSCAALCEAAPETRIVVYTADGDDELAREVLDAGAVASCSRRHRWPTSCARSRPHSDGSSYLDPALAKDPAPGGKLTQRELDVLGLLAEGLQHEEIGRRLGISSETVRTHLRKASDRLGASTRTQAVATALRLGLIT